MAGLLLLAGCTSSQTTSSIKSGAAKTVAVQTGDGSKRQVYHYTAADRECLKRAMYFESERSSKNGFMAVGSVVMNRLTSGAYPGTICGVVSQEKQFAPGVMTRKMEEDTAPELEDAANAILRGERHPQVKNAMFFHQNGLKFPYRNMHYVTVAGGNAFYEKRDRDGDLQTPAPKQSGEYVLSFAQPGSTNEGLTKITDMAQAPAPQPTAASVTAAAITPTTAAVAASAPSSQAETTEILASEDELLLPAIVPVPIRRPETSAQMAAVSHGDWSSHTQGNVVQ
ncbi:hypothetical protein LCM4573_18960 [Rhizobium sp. LCM 4573]|nr:hypothetical protein LCM4573_18960 [Rhizobium sp. LCM 4573]